MLLKLPEYLILRWSRKIAGLTDYPEFKIYMQFITEEADVLCNPITNFTYLDADSRKKGMQSRAYFATDTEEEHRNKCSYCNKNNHYIHVCYSFMEKRPEERLEYIKKKGLCFQCLKKGHVARTCTVRSICNKCSLKHPTCLHGDYEKLRNKDQGLSENNNYEGLSHRLFSEPKERIQTSIILPVYLSVRDNPSNPIMVYCILDTQRDTSFITEDAARILNVPFEETNLQLTTMNATSVIKCKKYNNLQIKGINESISVTLPTLFSITYPNTQNCQQLESLEMSADPRRVICGLNTEPFGQRTDLGWSIVGMSLSEDEKVNDLSSTHSIQTSVPYQLRLDKNLSNDVSFVYKTSCKEILDVLESDFSERKYEMKFQNDKLSQNDLKLLDMIEKTIHRDENGFYEMPLPFIDKPNLPNNKFVGEKNTRPFEETPSQRQTILR